MSNSEFDIGKPELPTKSTKNRLKNRSPDLRKSTQNRQKSTKGRSRDPPGTPPEHPRRPPVYNSASRTPPESAKSAQKSLPEAPGESQDHSQRPPGAPPSQKNAHRQRFYTKKVALPFFDRFFIDFWSFFEGADPWFVWPGPHESHFSIFRKSREKSHRK